jgi:hypothetical protein
LRYIVCIFSKTHHLVAALGYQPLLHRHSWFPLVVTHEPVREVEWLHADAMTERLTDELRKNLVVRNTTRESL